MSLQTSTRPSPLLDWEMAHEKICELHKAVFSVIYNISPPNFGILRLLKGSFREFRFFVWICVD